MKSEQHYHYELPTGSLSINTFDQRENWDFETCMGVGARQNPKRGFLFVSKLLGKHIPVTPSLMRAAHDELAAPLIDMLSNEPTLFVAMAETATGLGHGVYESALHKAGPEKPWIFCTTTRYPLSGWDKVDFTEDHSHATDQWMHIPNLPVKMDQITRLVLIDDEISTGNTMKNLEASLRDSLPALECVIWVTLTCLSRETAHPCIALVKGQYRFSASRLGTMPEKAVGNGKDVSAQLSRRWGRAGVMGRVLLGKDAMTQIDRLVEQSAPGDKPTLVLGQGELMHPAFRIAQQLENQGVSCRVQSTTRSPIMLHGAIGRAMSVPDPLGTDVNHYLYNYNPVDYKAVLIVSEPGALEQANNLADLMVNPLVINADL